MAGLIGPAAAGGEILPYAGLGQMTGMDRLMMLGAMLKDIGSYGQSNNVMNVAQMLAGRNLMGMQLQAGNNIARALAGGGDPTAAPPAAPGGPTPGVADPTSSFNPASASPAAAPPAGAAMPGNNSALMGALAAAARIPGMNIQPYLDVAKYGQPEYDISRDDMMYDKKTGRVIGRVGTHMMDVNGTLVPATDESWAGRQIPKPGEGQVVAYDASGRPMSIYNLPGNVQAQADVSGARAAREAEGRAAWTIQNIPYNGSDMPTVVRNAVLGQPGMGLPGGGGVMGGAQPLPAGGSNGGFHVQPVGGASGGGVQPPATPGPNVGFRTLTPAEQKLQTERAETQAEYERNKPVDFANVQNFDALANRATMIAHQLAGDTQDAKGNWVRNTDINKSAFHNYTVGVGNYLSLINGTSARNVEEQLNTLKSIALSDQLASLKAGSQNGSTGIGRVLQSEASAFGNQLGNLDPGQSPDQLFKNIRTYVDGLEQARSIIHQKFNDTYGAYQQQTPGNTQPIAPNYAAPAQGIPLSVLLAEKQRRLRGH